MARKRRTNGMPLTGDYLIVFSDGTRGTITKIGRRWWAKFPEAVKVRPKITRKTNLTPRPPKT
jgi:hypothetical protein